MHSTLTIPRQATSSEPGPGVASPDAGPGPVEADADMAVLFHRGLALHQALFAALGVLEAPLRLAAHRAAGVLREGGKLMFCGNGGSAADCQHLAAELTGRLLQDRRPLAAVALTTDTSALTCIGNDYGFDQVFSRQVVALGRRGDALLGLSTSGESANVLRAFEEARRMGILTIGLLGRGGGRLAALSDVPLIVPCEVTAHIQEAHGFLGHVFCAQLEAALGLRRPGG